MLKGAEATLESMLARIFDCAANGWLRLIF
jgi:hypothetical protein